MDENSETFVVHVVSIMETLAIHLARKSKIAALKVDKALTKVLAEYLDYA